jgi:hypothetical protein
VQVVTQDVMYYTDSSELMMVGMVMVDMANIAILVIYSFISISFHVFTSSAASTTLIEVVCCCKGGIDAMYGMP